MSSSTLWQEIEQLQDALREEHEQVADTLARTRTAIDRMVPQDARARRRLAQMLRAGRRAERAGDRG
jgi:phosphate uptake regulator